MSTSTDLVVAASGVLWASGSLFALYGIAFPLKRIPIMATRMRALACFVAVSVGVPFVGGTVLEADPAYQKLHQSQVSSGAPTVSGDTPMSSAAEAASSMASEPHKVITSRADCPPEDENDREEMRHGLLSQHSLCLLQADAAETGRREDAANKGLPPSKQHHEKMGWYGSSESAAPATVASVPGGGTSASEAPQ